jgi:hypothetical protein
VKPVVALILLSIAAPAQAQSPPVTCVRQGGVQTCDDGSVSARVGSRSSFQQFDFSPRQNAARQWPSDDPQHNGRR